MAATAPAPTVAQAIETARAEVRFQQGRVKRDPTGAIGLAMLAEAQLAVANLTDDDHAGAMAESAARESLKARKTNNVRAALALTHSLLQQHRFADAVESADMASTLAPDNLSAIRLRIETRLETGAYTEAGKLLAAHPELATTPDGLAVKARWADLHGEQSLASGLLAEASQLVEKSVGKTKALAPFVVLQAKHAFKYGKIENAEGLYQRALELDPTSNKAMAGLASVALSRKDFGTAEKLARESLDIASLTDVQGTLYAALKGQGRSDEAKNLLATMLKDNDVKNPDTAAGPHSHSKAVQARHTHSRLLAMFLAEHGLYPGLAHHIAEEDLSNRQDVYAHDAFAWTTYRYWKLVPASVTGEGDFLLNEAFAASNKAMATGSHDPVLVAHAKEISQAMKSAR